MGLDRSSLTSDCARAISELHDPRDFSTAVATLLKARDIYIVTILCLDAGIAAFTLTERGFETDPDQSFELLGDKEKYQYRSWVNTLPENLAVEFPQSGGCAMNAAILSKFCFAKPGSNLMFVKTRAIGIGEFSVVLSMEGAADRDDQLLAEVGVVIPLLVGKLASQVFSNHCRKLSDKEQLCLYWVSEGKNSEEIADLLEISKFTVNNYIQNAMRKLGAKSRAQAISKSMRAGIL